MHATIETHGPLLAVCRLSGSLDGDVLMHLRAVMAACASFQEVHLDLAKVVFLDSGGLGVLAGGIRRIRDDGGTVTVSTTTRHIRRVLRAVGFDRLVPIGDLPPIHERPAQVAS